MNRVRLLKLAYLAVLTALAAGTFAVGALTGAGMLPLFLMVVVVMLPGRIQAAFYRDLYASRRLLAQGRPAESIEHSRRFLELMHERPGLKRLLWLTWSIYTTDVEAMALNNLGAAEMQLGRWSAAEDAFTRALALDHRYAIPRFNLAVIQAARGNTSETERLLDEAVHNGYPRPKLASVQKMGDDLRAKGEAPALQAAAR